MDPLWQRMANLVFDIEKKNSGTESNPSIARISDKMKAVLEDAGVYLYNPVGEKYSDTRTDLEASISGAAVHNLQIKEVIKPALYTNENGRKVLVQKGVVVVSGE